MTKKLLFLVKHATFENTNAIFFTMEAADAYVHNMCTKYQTSFNEWHVKILREGEVFGGDIH
jgi:hypothetical protein